MELSLRDKKLVKFVFWLTTTGVLVATLFPPLILPSGKDVAVIGMFFWGLLSAFVGSFCGGWLGGVLEEDGQPCMDMGVLSTALAFILALVASFLFTALAATSSVYDGVASLVWWLVSAAPFLVGILVYLIARNRWAFVVIKKGTRSSGSLDASMTARITLLLVLTIQLIVWLTVAMVAIMQTMMDMLSMIGAMVWAMMGGVAGGSLGGWLGGITDVHQGAARMDNPIMVNIMALMGGAMGAMIGGGVGAYLGLLGGVGIIGTVIATAVLLLAGYNLLFRGRYGLVIVSQRKP